MLNGTSSYNVIYVFAHSNTAQIYRYNEMVAKNLGETEMKEKVRILENLDREHKEMSEEDWRRKKRTGDILPVVFPHNRCES